MFLWLFAIACLMVTGQSFPPACEKNADCDYLNNFFCITDEFRSECLDDLACSNTQCPAFPVPSNKCIFTVCDENDLCATRTCNLETHVCVESVGCVLRDETTPAPPNTSDKGLTVFIYLFSGFVLVAICVLLCVVRCAAIKKCCAGKKKAELL